MRVLIVGGAGLIGSHLAKELVEKDHEVTILDGLINYLSPFDKAGQLPQTYLKRSWSISDLLQLRFNDIQDKIPTYRQKK